MNDELLDASIISGVTGVTEGTPSNGAGCGVTPAVTDGVTGVTNVADLIASAEEPAEGEAQQETIKPVPAEDRPAFASMTAGR